jgi:hypothetical protein
MLLMAKKIKLEVFETILPGIVAYTIPSSAQVKE